MRDPFEQRILSRPVPVHWAGWETTTAALQSAGWELAVHFEFNRDRYTLLMRHQAMELWALSRTEQFGRYTSTLDSYYSNGDRDLPPFEVMHVGKSLFIQTPTSLDFASFQQIDARPQFTETKIRSVEDFNIFALARSKAEEILVNRADMGVIEHLEAIKRLQEPKQHEIRQRMLREDATRPTRATPKLHLVANIIHCEEQVA